MAEKEVKIQGSVVPQGREGLSPSEIERRAKVKKRAQELMAEGLTMSEAAQRAFAEVPAPRVELDFDRAEADALLKSREEADKLQRTRSAYIDQRTRQLEKQGIQKDAARSRSEKEFEDTYAKPVTSPYGSLEDMTPGGLLRGIIRPDAAPPTSLPQELTGGEATLETALRPQSFLPQDAVQYEKERMKKPQQAGLAGQGPDFKKINDELLQGGLDKDTADVQTGAYRAAYEAKLVQLQNDYREKKKVTPLNLGELAWKETTKELGGLSQALENKETYTKEAPRGGPNDPLFLAFSRQIKGGEGVPNLTEAQGAFVAETSRAQRSAAEERLRKEYEGKPLVITETEAVEGIRGARPRTVSRELVGKEKDAEISKMAAAEVETPWWSDPNEVKRRLADPEKFEERGILQSETPFGTQRESTVGYALRAGMAPLNAVAGWAFPKLFTGTGETAEAIDEARRRARPQAYKDSPILLNIAEGRGFVGEASEVAEITGLNSDELFGGITVGDVYKAGAFAADLLDPSLDFVAGFGRGAFTTAEIAKVGRQVGLKSKAALAAAEGSKDFLRTLAKENPALNLVASRMKVSPGDVRLAISERLADEVTDAVRGAGSASEPAIVREVRSQLDALDGTVAGGAARRLPTEKWSEALAEAAVRDPNILNSVRAAESAARIGELAEVRRALLASEPQILDATKDALVRQVVRNEVFKATKDTVLNSGIVSLTRRTFATPQVANKIMKEFASTPISKLVGEIRGNTSNYVFGTKKIAGPKQFTKRGTIVTEGYKINPAQTTEIKAGIEELVNRNVISRTLGKRLVEETKGGFVNSEAIRTLIDGSIDSIARKYSIATGSNIEELTPLIGRELGKPLEIRDFGAPILRNWALDKKLNRPVDALSPIQRSFVDQVVGKVGKLDARLRTDLSRFMKDAQMRSVYGAPDGLTRKQALGYLIAGPEGNESLVRNSLKLAVDKMFKSEKYIVDIFDLFQGVKVDELTDIWSVAGRKNLDALLKSASGIISATPERYYEQLVKLVEDARALTLDPNNLKSPDLVIKSPKGDVSNELLISSYYQAEADRAVKETLERLVDSERGFLNKRYTDLTSEELKAQLGLDAGQENFGKVVSEFINQQTIDPRFTELSLREQFTKIRKAQPGLPDVDDRALGELMAEATNTAEIVYRVNGIPAMGKPVEELMRIVEEASKRGGNLEASMNAIFGTKVADQVRSSLSATGKANIEKGLSDLFAEAAEGYMVGKTRIPPIKSIPGKLWNSAMSLFYTLVLTAAPRFHGANIIGAPSLAYSTTGKLLSPLPIPGTSTYDSLRMMMDAGTSKGGRIVAKDAAGRTYTADEVNRAIVERGGETVNRAQIPAIAARGALYQISEGAGGAAKRALDFALETPQYEDQMFRGAVALEALREGRNIDEAVSLARAAMYDKGTISEGEAILAKNLMFYSFSRNNLVNFLKNLTKPEGWKRIANTARLKRGVESFTVSDDEKKYIPSNAATRIVLGTANKSGKNQFIIATPGDSTLGAIELLSSILALDFNGIATSMMKPGQSIFFGQKDVRKMNKIPPEHVAVYEAISQLFPGVDAEDVMSALSGDTISPVKSNDPDAVNGVIYPLLTEDSRDTYTNVINALGYIGIGRLMNDYPSSLRAPGTKASLAFEEGNVGYGLTGLYASGFITPLKQLGENQQRLRALTKQTAEGKKLISEVDDVILKGELAPAPGDKEGIVERVRTGKRKKSEGMLSISDYDKEKLRLRREIDGIRAKLMTDPAKERQDIYVKEIYKRVDRINEINAIQQKMNPKKQKQKQTKK